MQLGEKFEGLRIRSEELTTAEGRENERSNLEGWKVWKDTAVPGWGLEEKVQVLDEVLTGAWKYSEPGSRYSRCVKKFEKWLVTIEDVMDARAKGEQPELEVSALDSAWRDECEGLERKLGLWRQKVRKLGDIDGNSALASTMSGSRNLVRGMHDQVIGMLRVEKRVRNQEREWISRTCDEDSDDDGDVGRSVGGAWRL